MIYQYVVTLKNERVRSVNMVSMLLCLISACFFISQQVKQGSRSYLFLVSFLLILGGFGWNWYQFTRNKRKPSYSRILLVAGLTWFAMPVLAWIGIPLIGLALIEKMAKFPLEIGFTDEKIVINTLIKRRFNWSDFTNVLLKDNILTMDFKNNRIIQKETIDDDPDADEDEFNAYCKRQLNAPETPR